MNFKLNIIPLSLQYKQTTDSLLYYLSISIIIGKNMTAKELDITQVKDRLAPYNHLTEDTAPNAVELSVEVNPLGNISVRPTNLSIIVSSSKSYEIENVILLNIPILISSKNFFWIILTFFQFHGIFVTYNLRTNRTNISILSLMVYIYQFNYYMYMRTIFPREIEI